jgi:hypothetical protein
MVLMALRHSRLFHFCTDSPWCVCPFVTIFHSVSSDVTSGFPSFPFYFYFLTFASMCMSSFTSLFLLRFLYCFLFMALANSLFDSSILFLCIYTLYPPIDFLSTLLLYLLCLACVAYLSLYPDDRGSRFLWKLCTYLPDYMASHPRKKLSSFLEFLTSSV